MIKIKKPFVKICNILHSPDADYYWHNSFIGKKDLTYMLQNDNERINLINNNVSTNPKYLLLSLSWIIDKIVFTHESNSSHWIFNDCVIKHKQTKLFLSVEDNKLTLSKIKQKWIIHDTCLEHFDTHQFIASDIDYNIYMTTDKMDALDIKIENNMICHVKSDLRVKFEMNNAKLKCFNFVNLNKQISKVRSKNVGVLLAGGFSTRFNNNVPKQLFDIKDKPAILYSVDAMTKVLDKVAIITNDKCFDQINKLVSKYKSVIVLKNNINDRLESLAAGLKYFSKQKDIQNVIIHDSARCFIQSSHFKNLISDQYYSQYYLKLTNGLSQTNFIGDVNRDDYIELVTPLCINFTLGNFIFTNYIKAENRITYEFINILRMLKIPYKMIEGHYNFLKKITTAEDVKNV
jgi:2-C-methyl-D-erythritol 4-phosphate cytidylyltransferase